MNTPRHIENDIRHADRRHPVDFLEPIDDGIDRICEVLRRLRLGGRRCETPEQKGLRASVVLYCVRADLIGVSTLEELGAVAGFPQPAVDRLVADFCHTIGWK